MKVPPSSSSYEMIPHISDLTIGRKECAHIVRQRTDIFVAPRSLHLGECVRRLHEQCKKSDDKRLDQRIRGETFSLRSSVGLP